MSYRFTSWAWNRLRSSLVERFGAFAYFRSVEEQQRGAPHYHLVVATPRTFWPMEEVRRLGVLAGFGPRVQLEAARSAEGAAHYVTKYATKTAGDVLGVPRGWRFYVASKVWRSFLVALPRITDGAVTWANVREGDVEAVAEALHRYAQAPPTLGASTKGSDE